MKLCTKVGSLLVCLFMASACATNLSKPTQAIVPSKVRLGEFKSIQMKAVEISPAFSGSAANQKACAKIDELLFRNVAMVLPGLKRVEAGAAFSKSSDKTLWITPTIKEIKFIGGGARFWVGAMAGSSAVLMQTVYQDGASGETIAAPEFYRQANAMKGAYSIGATDNLMLEDVAKDIVSYMTNNK